MYNLYLCYEYGEGVPEDDYVAFSWAMKAAQAGDDYAYVVGMGYQYGYGVEKNLEEARRWFEKALESDDYPMTAMTAPPVPVPKPPGPPLTGSTRLS